MKEYKDLKETTKTSSEVFSGKMLHAFNDVVTLPNGKESTREYVHHIGAVAIVPITEDGQVILEEQYRYPVHRVVTEVPAGKLDTPDEDRLEAAKRELREETGIQADTWIRLGLYYPAAAYCDEVIELFIAKDLHYSEQELDEDEFLNIIKMPLGEAVAAVKNGKIADGKTQVSLLLAADILSDNK